MSNHITFDYGGVVVIEYFDASRAIGIKEGDNDGPAIIASVNQWPDAELHALTEAILGRKVAAVFYEDELPEVTDTESPVTVRIGGARHTALNRDLSALREMAVRYLATARHIEARDAAAKEQERAEEERVRADVLSEVDEWFHAIRNWFAAKLEGGASDG